LLVRTKAKELATLLRDKDSLLKERAEFYSLYSHEFSVSSIRSGLDDLSGDPPPYDYSKDSLQEGGERRGHRRNVSSSSSTSSHSSHRRTPSAPQSQVQQMMQPPVAQNQLPLPQHQQHHQKVKTHNTGPTVFASEFKVPPLQGSAFPGRAPERASSAILLQRQQDPRDDDFDPRAYAKAPGPSQSTPAQNLISPKISGTSAKSHHTGSHDPQSAPRKSSLYGKEVALLQDMSERSYENLLAKQSDATILNDAFALETWRTKIKSFGWRGKRLFSSPFFNSGRCSPKDFVLYPDVRKLFGMGDCGVLLCHVIKLILDRRLAIEDVEFQFGHKDSNVADERKALLQWLYVNGMKHDSIKLGLLAEALTQFPNEFSEQVSFSKYLTKMSQRFVSFLSNHYHYRLLLLFRS